MDKLKQNRHTCTLCEKMIFSCNLFHPASRLPFDTLNSEFLGKFQNKFPALQKNASPLES